MHANHRTRIFVLSFLLLFGIVGTAALTSAQAPAPDQGKKEPCVSNAAGPLVPGNAPAMAAAAPAFLPPMARVGKEAPDFEAIAYHNGSFKKVKLSDYKGKWVILCFYPGDFTFV